MKRKREGLKLKFNSLLNLLLVSSIVFIITGIALIFQFPDRELLIIILAIGILFFIGSIIVLVKNRVELRLREKEEIGERTEIRIGHTFDAYDQRIKRALQIAKSKKDGRSLIDGVSIRKYSGKLETDDVCMVCKLSLTKQDEILQCPKCESLFHKEHLLEWITIKKSCPVCHYVLDKKQE